MKTIKLNKINVLYRVQALEIIKDICGALGIPFKQDQIEKNKYTMADLDFKELIEILEIRNCDINIDNEEMQTEEEYDFNIMIANALKEEQAAKWYYF